jgi:hypothetical protein
VRIITSLFALSSILLFSPNRALASANEANNSSISLAQARQGFHTTLLPAVKGDREPIEEPPPERLNKVKYPSTVGDLGALISPLATDGKKHPALIWIHGGPCNDVSVDLCLNPGPKENDQSGSIFRKLGIITMYPSFRGGNDNPGALEGFLGEVDDVSAAANYLAKRADVDPERIYLGGHSTGATLALLTDECAANKFRAVFCFGAAFDVSRYDRSYLPFAPGNPQEVRLRSPGYWLACAKSPTFVFEGEDRPSNVGGLRRMQQASTNPLLHFYAVAHATHFSILAPTTKLIADKIIADSGASMGISFTDAELSTAFADQPWGFHGCGQIK